MEAHSPSPVELENDAEEVEAGEDADAGGDVDKREGGDAGVQGRAEARREHNRPVQEVSLRPPGGGEGSCLP